MSEYVFPYWDDMDYWENRRKKDNKNRKTVEDDSLGKTVED